MDLWVVAAATGAGYIAKYWQNFSGEKDGSSDSLTGNSIQGQSEPPNLLQNQTDPFHKLAQKRLGGFVSSDREDVSDGIASTSGSNDNTWGNFDNHEDYNFLSLANPSPGFGATENLEGNAYEISGRNEFLGNSGDRLIRNGSLRSRRSRGLLVRSSLESCLNAQLYREHTKLEEYVYSSVPSPCTPAVRPLLVTDGSRIISRVDSDPLGVCLEGNNTLSRTQVTQPLLCRGLMELPRKPKQRSGGPVNSQGSANGMLLFFIGITIGIMSTSVANKRELDKLNKLLRQSENLVEDLHEELEMKDILTMKDLTNESNQSQRTIESNEPNDQKVSPEVMSKIEAELEAELERLELNMKGSSLESISNFVELDPDFEADVVQGELKLNVVNRQTGGSTDSDRDASGTTTDHTDSAKYAVSPRELTLRLHELIESRLEARIKELEAALENSEKRFQSLESQTIIYSEVGSSYTPESPTFVNEGNERERPLLMNLSGDALDAYNEAYEEMIKITGTVDQNTSDNDLFDDRNDGSSLHRDGTEERWSGSLVRDKIRTWEDKSRESNEVGESEDDDEDELGQLLIKQIVEKTRQGSSLGLNVHQMYSLDGDS